MTWPADFHHSLKYEWTQLNPSPSTHSSLSQQVGGFDGNSRLRSVEAYNPETNAWTNVASMITTRSNFGIEVVEDRLFVVGGFNGFTTSYHVECYDSTRNEWLEVCGMGIFRSAVSCCVIAGLPNMPEYVVPRDALPLLPLEEDHESDSGDSS